MQKVSHVSVLLKTTYYIIGLLLLVMLQCVRSILCCSWLRWS